MNILSKVIICCFVVLTVVSNPLAAAGEAENIAATQGKMYRSIDANGRVIYSDRPGLTGATSYTPKQIGYISASGVPEKVKSESTETATQAPAAATVKSGRPLPEFRFSNTSAGQKHGYVLMTGRISGGYACKRLQVTARAISDTGRSKNGRDIVSYNGFGSTLYEIKKSSSWKGKGRRPQWEPVSTGVVCLD